MPRNILQDVVPPNRKSIRNVPIPRSSSRSLENDEPEIISVTRKSDNHNHEPENKFEDLSSGTTRHQGRSPIDYSRFFIWIVGIVSTVAVIFVVGNYFSDAELRITPMTKSVSIDSNFVAKPKADDKSISYSSVVLNKEKELLVPADSEKSVELSASGKIIIYNNYSVTSQRLVKNTRFETPDGLIYKIHDSITIPGKTTTQGKVTPGSVTVTVYAESAGAEYNIGLTDFTIPGFKSNSARFTGFYARSKTPMTGGKIGKVKSISDNKMVEAKARLEGQMKQDFLAEAKLKLTADKIFYDDAYRVSFEDSTIVGESTGDSVKIKERGVFTAFFFAKDEIARAIASSTIATYDGSPVTLANADDLIFSFNNKSEYSATSIGPINLNLKGSAKLVWQFDEAKLKADLIGKKKSSLSEVISKYPQIIKVSTIIRPIWNNSFPGSPSKITIITE